MNRRLLVALLALWCVLAVAPGLVTALAFGAYHPDDDLGASGEAIWIGGYLLQFAVFVAIVLKYRRKDLIGWLIPCLMPWASIWVASVSPWWLAPCLAVTGGYAYWCYRSATRAETLDTQGIRAFGTVLEVVDPRFNVLINNVYLKRTLRVRVERDGAAPYEATCRGTFMLGELPSPGDTFRLRVDPKDPTRVAIDSSRRPANIKSATRPTSFVDELQRLADLHRQGALTDDEYAAAKRKVLS